MSHTATGDWEQAMVSGNGRQGVLCYGTPASLHMTLSHERLFLPVDEPLPAPHTARILPELRALCYQGRFQEAADEVCRFAAAGDERYGRLRQIDPFVGAATLTVRPQRPPGTATAWRRELEFDTGVVRQRWSEPAGPVCQEVFASRRHDVIVARLRGPTGLTGSLWLHEIAGTPPVPIHFAHHATTTLLLLRASFPRHWPGGIAGYRVTCRVVATGGRVRVAPRGALQFDGVGELLLLVRTIVNREPDITQQATQNTQTTQTTQTTAEQALDEIPADFDELLRAHVTVHGALFDRCRLELGNGGDLDNGGERDEPGPPTEQLLAGPPTEQLLAGPPRPALIQRLFDAGRYLTISATGELPPNLQGVWSGTYEPAWRGGYTLDGNLPAALAGAGPTGTPELLLALFDLLDTYADDFGDNARRLYGLPGPLLPPHLSTHGRHNHFTATWCLTFWTAGAAWMASIYLEYWRYTNDDSFLRERVLPFLRAAAEFSAAFVEERDGSAHFCPSYSPENAPAGTDTQACVDSTMDVAAVRALLRALIELGDPQSPRWRALLDRLPRYRVDADGTLAEWLRPGLANNHAHRHASHLFGLWYDPDPDLLDDPALRAAAVAAVRARLAWWREHGDEMAYGLTQLGLAAAALDLAEEAEAILHLLAARYWRANLVPTHNVGKIFNTDICGGLPAVVVAMLVRARAGRVEVLPALPHAWPAGELHGALLRGGLAVRHLRWSPELVTVELVSNADRAVEVRASARLAVDAHLAAGRPVRITFAREGR